MISIDFHIEVSYNDYNNVVYNVDVNNVDVNNVVWSKP